MTNRKSKWGGARSKKARALFIGRFPLPCFRCGRAIHETDRWHADHIVPQAHGGTDDPENLWPSHGRCNESHGSAVGRERKESRRVVVAREDQRLMTW